MTKQELGKDYIIIIKSHINIQSFLGAAFIRRFIGPVDHEVGRSSEFIAAQVRAPREPVWPGTYKNKD